MQQDARDELKVISQSRGASLSELPGYAYDSRGGRGITVYLIDTGINPNHEVRVTRYQESIRPHSYPGIQKYVGKHTLALSTR
jgi:subtilisin family serine protease